MPFHSTLQAQTVNGDCILAEANIITIFEYERLIKYYRYGPLGVLMNGLTEDVRGEFLIETKEATCILIEFQQDQLFFKKPKPHREFSAAPL